MKADMTPDTDSQQLILDAVDRFLKTEVRPHVKRLEHADEYPHEIVEQMKQMGLFGSIIPADYGGLGLSTATYAAIVARMAAVWMSLSGIINSHLIMASAVMRCGTEAQKRDLLPRFASGDLRGGIGLTEPDAGTDLQAIRTRAVRDGDHYVINGSKTWITNSLHGGCLALLVKTDPQAEPRHKGMSLFIAEKGPGFIVTRKLKKLGYRGIDTCELQFDNYRVPADRLIGGVEGRGLQQVLSGLELGRINVAARGLGVATASLHDAVAYAQQRKTFGKPICEHQAIQLKLSEMVTQVEAAKHLIESAARKHDRNERCDLEAAMAKLAGSEAGVYCAQEAMRIFGGYSYSVEYEIERYYRDCMLMVIGEGSNEILRQVISKQLIARNRI